MQPLNRLSSVWRISAGATQLLVGPASSLRSLQMKVRSSTRATSSGSDHANQELGRLAGFRRRNVPAASSRVHRFADSSAEPSHQWMESGWVSAAILATQ